MRDMVEPNRSQFSLSCTCSQSVVHHSIAWNRKGGIRHVSRLHVFGRLFQCRPDHFLVSDSFSLLLQGPGKVLSCFLMSLARRHSLAKC